MSFNPEEQKAALMRFALERQAAAHSKKKRKRATRESGGATSKEPSSFPGSSSLPQESGDIPSEGVRAENLSYPEGGELFVPKWNLKTEESITTDLVSAMKFWDGCVPPVDDEVVRNHPDEHLKGIAAKSISTALVACREMSRRVSDRDDLARSNFERVKELEAALQEKEAETIRIEKEAKERESPLEGRMSELNRKLEEEEGVRAQMVADYEEKLRKMKETQIEKDLGTFGMAWKELKGKVEEEFHLSIDHIQPSIPFELEVQAPSETATEDEDGDEEEIGAVDKGETEVGAGSGGEEGIAP